MGNICNFECVYESIGSIKNEHMESREDVRFCGPVAIGFVDEEII